MVRRVVGILVGRRRCSSSRGWWWGGWCTTRLVVVGPLCCCPSVASATLVAALPSGLWAPERAHAVGQCVSSAVGHQSLLVCAGSNDIIRSIQSAAKAVACGWLLPFTINRRLIPGCSDPVFFFGCLESADCPDQWHSRADAATNWASRTCVCAMRK